MSTGPLMAGGGWIRLACAALLAGALLLVLWLPTERGALERWRHYQRMETTSDAMEEIAGLAFEAKQRSGQPLWRITGTGCSDCSCRGGKRLNGASVEEDCRAAWEHALEAIWKTAGKEGLPPARLRRDAWGNLLALDENEMENGNCLPDTLRSPGPDGVLYTPDDLALTIRNAFASDAIRP